MKLKKYFEETKGTGILATANDAGEVDVAIYSRPHVMDEGTIAFIMADRLSHTNLQSNGRAAYLFKEGGGGRTGKRLYLTWLREEKNSPLIEELRRTHRDMAPGEDSFLVFFRVDQERPLVGDQPGDGQ